MIREAMLDVMSAFMNETREGLNAIKRDLEQYKNHTTSKLSDLNFSINDIKKDLYEKADDTNEKVCNFSEIENNVLSNVTKQLQKTSDYMCEGAGSLRSAERRESCLKYIGRSEGRGNV